MSSGAAGAVGLSEQEELALLDEASSDSSSDEDEDEDDDDDEADIDHEEDEDILFNLDTTRLEGAPEVKEVLEAETDLKKAHIECLKRALARNSHTVWALMRLG